MAWGRENQPTNHTNNNNNKNLKPDAAPDTGVTAESLMGKQHLVRLWEASAGLKIYWVQEISVRLWLGKVL